MSTDKENKTAPQVAGWWENPDIFEYHEYNANVDVKGEVDAFWNQL